MDYLLLALLPTLLQHMPHPHPPADQGVWWTHWAWMVLWVILGILIILFVVRMLWTPRRR